MLLLKYWNYLSQETSVCEISSWLACRPETSLGFPFCSKHSWERLPTVFTG